jgi:hypothetical protein
MATTDLAPPPQPLAVPFISKKEYLDGAEVDWYEWDTENETIVTAGSVFGKDRKSGGTINDNGLLNQLELLVAMKGYLTETEIVEMVGAVMKEKKLEYYNHAKKTATEFLKATSNNRLATYIREKIELYDWEFGRNDKGSTVTTLSITPDHETNEHLLQRRELKQSFLASIDEDVRILGDIFDQRIAALESRTEPPTTLKTSDSSRKDNRFIAGAIDRLQEMKKKYCRRPGNIVLGATPMTDISPPGRTFNTFTEHEKLQFFLPDFRKMAFPFLYWCQPMKLAHTLMDDAMDDYFGHFFAHSCVCVDRFILRSGRKVLTGKKVWNML